MKRSILSLMLSFIMVFTAFSAVIPAMAEGEAVENIYPEYNDAVSLLTSVCPDLPLTDGESTTRAEFTASITKLLRCDGAPVTEAVYADVPAEYVYASEISFAKDLGLISKSENFNPDNPIKYTEAVKILVCALGYGEKAELTGGYPTAYLKIADQLDIRADESLTSDSELSHKDSIILLFNAVCADIAEQTSFGSTVEYTSTEGKNILSVYHKIYMTEGVVDATEFTGLYNTVNTASESSIAINKTSFYGEGYDGLLGRNTRIFYRDDSKKTIVYAYAFDSKEYTYTSEDSFDLSGFTLTVTQDSDLKEKRFKLNGKYSVIYNGKYLSSADYAGDLKNIKSGTVTLVENGNTGIDVIIIKEFEYGVVGNAGSLSEKVFDAYKKDGALDLSKADYYDIKDPEGNPLTLKDLKANDSIGIAASKDGKRVEIVRYRNILGGVYTERSSNGTIILDGKEYKLSSYYTENVKSLENIKFGTEVMIYLGIGNTIINLVEMESMINYGYIIEVGTKDAGSISEQDVVRMLCSSSGKIEILPLAQNVKLNGVPTGKAAVLARLKEISEYTNDGTALPNGSTYKYLWRVIKYSFNSKNELTSVWTTEDDKVTKISDGAADNPDLLKADYQAQISKIYDSDIIADSQPRLFDDNTAHAGTDGLVYYDDNMFYPFFRGASDAVAFVVPEPAAGSEWKLEKDYSVTNMSGVASWVGSEVNTNCFGYDVDRNGAHLVLCVGGSASGTVSETSTSRVVESVSKAVNDDGEIVTVLKMYYSGNWVKYSALPEKDISDSDSKKFLYGTEEEMVKPGDIIGISVNNDNEIVAIAREFSYLDGKALSDTFTNFKEDKNTGIDVIKYSRKKKDYVSGYAYSLDGTRVQLACVSEDDLENGNFGVVQMRPANLSTGTVVFVKFDRDYKNATVYKEPDTNGVETYYTSGMDADYIVIRSRFEEIALTVIYTN